jgi:hypothetical protein
VPEISNRCVCCKSTICHSDQGRRSFVKKMHLVSTYDYVSFITVVYEHSKTLSTTCYDVTSPHCTYSFAIPTKFDRLRLIALSYFQSVFFVDLIYRYLIFITGDDSRHKKFFLLHLEINNTDTSIGEGLSCIKIFQIYFLHFHTLVPTESI